jgi:hypothetical protein
VLRTCCARLTSWEQAPAGLGFACMQADEIKEAPSIAGEPDPQRSLRREAQGLTQRYCVSLRSPRQLKAEGFRWTRLRL